MQGQSKHELIVSEVADLVLRLSKAIRAIPGINRHDMWPLHPDREAPGEYVEARVISNQVIAKVRAANPCMISDRLVLTKLVYGVAATVLDSEVSDGEIAEKARSEVDKLLRFEAWRAVDVPIVSLDIGQRPFSLGPVRFLAFTPEDKRTDWWVQTKAYVGDDMADQLLLSYARVKSPGDLETCVSYAASIASEALLVLRAIGFPLSGLDVPQIGILNDYPLWQNRPFRLAEPQENMSLEFPSRSVTTIRSLGFRYVLHADILSRIDPARLAELKLIVDEEGFTPQQEMKAKLLNGLRWLGEATRPDALSARFVKLAFALEAFVGGEPNEELLTTRGITATLAERSAFLAATCKSQRLEVDREVRKYYSKRSSIAHGRAGDIHPEDLQGFGDLVRRIAWGFLDHIALFSTVNELQQWVIDQRYAAPSHGHSDSSTNCGGATVL